MFTEGHLQSSQESREDPQSQAAFQAAGRGNSSLSAWLPQLDVLATHLAILLNSASDSMLCGNAADF